MTKLGLITKGLLGTSVISLLAASNAFAGGTAAGTNVQNTFTLNYQVGGTDQPEIENSGTPTEFTVDRLVDLTVASSGDATVAPGATDQELVFTVTNNGNDTQAYSFALVNESGDDFNTTGTLSINYIIDDGTGGVCDADDLAGSMTAYTPGSGDASADLPADGVICVVVEGDIPAVLADADEAELSLVSDTLQPTTGASAGTAVVADAGGNTLTGAAENVLADASGTGNEVAFAGDHSATGTYIIASADLTASKAVSIYTEDGSDCTDIPGAAVAGDQYSIPGACVEYVITTENTGATASATSIVINDILPDSLTFVNATTGGFTGGSFSLPTTALEKDCDGTAATCEVELTGATLAAGATGTITIRALVK